MRLEKDVVIAIVGLVVIVGVVAAAFVYLNYFYKEEKIVEIGDCIDINYVGRYASNNTVFDTSYADIANQSGIYNESKEPYKPLKIFVDPKRTSQPPERYENYSSSPFAMIKGFIGNLIGMKEGENKTVTLSSEDAYGDWNETMAEMMGMGTYPLDSVINCTQEENKSMFLQYFSDVEIALNSTFDYGSVALGVDGILNATIINTTDTNITYKLLPENGTTFTQPMANWTVIFVVENDTAFTMHSDIEVNYTFSIESPYGFLHFKVMDVNETAAKLAMNMGAPDIKFVGQRLVFELEVVNIYKTSQAES